MTVVHIIYWPKRPDELNKCLPLSWQISSLQHSPENLVIAVSSMPWALFYVRVFKVASFNFFPIYLTRCFLNNISLMSRTLLNHAICLRADCGRTLTPFSLGSAVTRCYFSAGRRAPLMRKQAEATGSVRPSAQPRTSLRPGTRGPVITVGVSSGWDRMSAGLSLEGWLVCSPWGSFASSELVPSWGMSSGWCWSGAEVHRCLDQVAWDTWKGQECFAELVAANRTFRCQRSGWLSPSVCGAHSFWGILTVLVEQWDHLGRILILYRIPETHSSLWTFAL